ncbi:hypothetical protein REPUB_Repub06bG0133700 [Reevesia pubescens]
MSEGSESLSSRTKHFSHNHPLEFTEEQKNNGSEEVDCSGCWEPIQGSSYYCCIDCKFYLHKTCADLPLNINHPLHEHTLDLKVKSPYFPDPPNCCLCFEKGRFVYHCSSCNFDLDVKCALFAGDFSKFPHFTHAHPLIFIQRHKNEKYFSCAACDKPTSGPIYSCMGCKFYLHKECADQLLPEITHPSHHKHPLMFLEKPPVHRKRCFCHLCINPNYKGFIYHCSFCEFGIKIKHIFSSQSEKGTHEHPFILLTKPMEFLCDACGTGGDCIPYICTTCHLAVHKECISLRQTIRITRHNHPISHKYFLPDKEHTRWNCKICNKEVNTEYGSYSCLDCNYIVHVKCAIDEYWLLEEGEDELQDETLYSAVDVSPTEIKHFSHEHNLTFSEEKINNTYCTGCMQIISGPFYDCKKCDFVVHKSCAKLPMKGRFWFSQRVFTLQACRTFIFPDTLKHQGHKHPLFYDYEYKGNCSGCGSKSIYAFRLIQVNLIVIFVKKKETQLSGFTTVKIATLPLIPHANDQIERLQAAADAPSYHARGKIIPSGEGLAFILTDSITFPINSGGQWFGIVNVSTINVNNIVAVEFDTRKSDSVDVDDNHVGDLE